MSLAGGASPGALQGKAALVLGASRGIGETIARAFAASGARVMLAARDTEAMRTIAAGIDPGGRQAQAVRADMTDSASVAAAVAATVAAFGGLDIAVNNAGVQLPRTALIDIADEDFDALMQVNLRGVFVALRSEIRAMLAGGGGAILNIASSAGLVGLPMISPYVASKHGVVGLTKAAAIEYASQGVRINALAPGMVMTDMLRVGPASSPEALAAMTARVPMGRIGESAEIAAAAVWLCSDAASYVTGAIMPVDGGYTTP